MRKSLLQQREKETQYFELPEGWYKGEEDVKGFGDFDRVFAVMPRVKGWYKECEIWHNIGLGHIEHLATATTPFNAIKVVNAILNR